MGGCRSPIAMSQVEPHENCHIPLWRGGRLDGARCLEVGMGTKWNVFGPVTKVKSPRGRLAWRGVIDCDGWGVLRGMWGGPGQAVRLGERLPGGGSEDWWPGCDFCADEVGTSCLLSRLCWA